MNQAPVNFPEWAERLAGDAEVPEEAKTTMIYTHVLNRPGVTVRSPLDEPRARADE